MLVDPDLRLLDNDQESLKVGESEGLGILSSSIRALVRAGQGHVVERTLLPFVLPDARLDAAAAQRGHRLGFVMLRCHGLISFGVS